MRRRVDGTDSAATAPSARTGPPPKDTQPQDSGFSLVEMVVTITLMSLVMLPLMVAAWSLIRNSSFNRTATRVETVLSNAADKVNRARETCDYTIYYQAAVQSEKWPTSQVSVAYAWYEPGPSATTAGVWHTGAACPSAGYTDGLVQRIDITVTSPDGIVTRSMQVVKSEI